LLVGVGTARLRNSLFVSGTSRHMELVLVTGGTVGLLVVHRPRVSSTV